MKDLRLITLLVLTLSVSAIRYTTYEPIIEQLYFTGNDIRKNPTLLKDRVNGLDQEFVASRGKAKPLEWSDGLSRSCRDLVLDIGQFGLLGHETSTGKTAKDRAHIYLNAFSKLEETLVYNPIDDVAKSEREPYDIYELMLKNEHERLNHFNPDFTHVGIACGCHSSQTEVCCFAYGSGVVNKKGVDTMDVAMINPKSCEDSAKYSENLKAGKGNSLNLPESVKPQPKDKGPQKWDTKEDKTYETIARKVFSSYKILANDKNEWLEGITDMKVREEARKFKSVSIEWSENLAAIALAFENEAAPCDSATNKKGESLMVFALNYIEDYEGLHMLSFEGPYTSNPKDVIIDQLKRGRFDEDQFNGKFKEMGVGCSCNGAKGMECLIIFGTDVKLDSKFPIKPEWSPIVQKTECMAKCTY